jgi:hypothetical protein
VITRSRTFATAQTNEHDELSSATPSIKTADAFRSNPLIISHEDNDENEVKIVELSQYEHVRPHIAFMPFKCDVFMND